MEPGREVSTVDRRQRSKRGTFVQGFTGHGMVEVLTKSYQDKRSSERAERRVVLDKVSPRRLEGSLSTVEKTRGYRVHT